MRVRVLEKRENAAGMTVEVWQLRFLLHAWPPVIRPRPVVPRCWLFDGCRTLYPPECVHIWKLCSALTQREREWTVVYCCDTLSMNPCYTPHGFCPSLSVCLSICCSIYHSWAWKIYLSKNNSFFFFRVNVIYSKAILSSVLLAPTYLNRHICDICPLKLISRTFFAFIIDIFPPNLTKCMCHLTFYQ